MKRTLTGFVLACMVWTSTAHAADPPAALTASAASDPISQGSTYQGYPIDDSTLDLLGANLEKRNPYRAGQMDLQAMVGYFKNSGWGPGGPDFNYAPFAVRVGWMLTTPCDYDGWLRGNAEVLLEVNYAPVLEAFGSYVTGPNLIGRYNFVQPVSLIVPYLQVGAGLAFNDAYKVPFPTQGLIGEAVEFLLRGEVGARLMMSDNFSLDAEFGYQHISNAGLALRNGGVNNVGFSLGLTYFFGRPD